MNLAFVIPEENLFELFFKSVQLQSDVSKRTVTNPHIVYAFIHKVRSICCCYF